MQSIVHDNEDAGGKLSALTGLIFLQGKTDVGLSCAEHIFEHVLVFYITRNVAELFKIL